MLAEILSLYVAIIGLAAPGNNSLIITTTLQYPIKFKNIREILI